MNLDIKDIAQEMHPKSMAARDWVFQVIRTAIIRGVLPGGLPLRQDEISAKLSVSHIPVREAFRQLEAQGLVRIYPNRGAVVTKLTLDEMSNVMDTRIILELGAIRAAIPQMTEDVIKRAHMIIEDSLSEKDYHKLEELNLKLHFTLYEPANNPTLFALIDQLHANVDRYVRPYYSDNCHHKQSRKEHTELLEACKNKDADLAAAILRTHLEAVKVLLLSQPPSEE